MYVTRKADYAVRCILHLSRHPLKVITVSDISKSMKIPMSFLSKILQSLMKHDIVKSVRGVKGGFRLAKEPGDINLLQVIEAVQGPSAANVCALDKKLCRLSRTCSVHPVWVEIREVVEKRLKEETFAMLLARKQ